MPMASRTRRTAGKARPSQPKPKPERKPESKSAFPVLPPEIWERIVDLIVPQIIPGQHPCPETPTKSLKHRSPFPLDWKKDLVALASTCRQLNIICSQRLFHAPFLKDADAVNAFSQAMQRLDHGDLFAAMCKSAQWIHGLHIGSAVTNIDRPDHPHKCVTCPTHAVLSRATTEVQYISLDCTYSGEGDDNEAGDLRNHPLVDFLSPATKCRPRGLKLSLRGASRIYMREVTSYAPLSELTHIELERVVPPAPLMAFLVGNCRLCFNWPTALKEAINTGLSPHLKLQSLRFSDLPSDTLHNFGSYMDWRDQFDAWARQTEAERAQHLMPQRLDLEPDEECLLDTLVDLAQSSARLPNLRLLILDIDSLPKAPPQRATLNSLVDEGVLHNVTSRFPSAAAATDYATDLVSSLFVRSEQSWKAANRIEGNPSFSCREQFAWNDSVADAEEHWLKTKEGMRRFVRIWNRSRNANPADSVACVQTEIRLTSGRYHNSEQTDIEKSFRCQVEQHSPSKPGGPGAKLSDLGIWADPDVFELSESKPWLPYTQLNEFGSCWWTAELPLSRQPVIIFDEAALSDREREEIHRRMKRGPQEGQGAEEAASKRLRIESNGPDEAGPPVN